MSRNLVATSPVAYSIDDALKVLPVSRQTLYDLINQGALRSFKQGRRRLISRAALLNYIAEREAAERQSQPA